MFVHETHLPQLLKPEHYTCANHYQREVEQLFDPTWQCIGALTDLPNDGDYITRNVCGRPLIAWRRGDEVHTFLNVCTHRFSMLRDKPCGHMGERLVCQYHGWEYDESGDTRRIPDAQSFRPMERGALGLRKFRTELAGQLIYVTLNDKAPSLPEFLGDYLYDMCQRWFSPDHQLTLAVDMEHECNWKVVVENVLEGYHVNSVHPKSFKTYPEPERCSHEFHEFWDLYKDDYSQGGLFNRQEAFVSWLAGVEPDFTWKHLLRYPNIVFGQMGLFTWVQMVFPVSPSQCQAMWRIFCYAGPRGTLRTKLLGKVLRSWGRKFMTQVIGEDAAVYPSIYRGIASPMRPNGGLVSIREERIFPFQRYVLKSTSTNGKVPEGSAEHVHQ